MAETMKDPMGLLLAAARVDPVLMTAARQVAGKIDRQAARLAERQLQASLFVDENSALRGDLLVAREAWAAERQARRQLAEALPVVMTAVERSTPAHADDREWTRTVAIPMAQRALAASAALD